MPAPHDLDYSAQTEEERRQKNMQDALIGFEMYRWKILRDYYEEKEQRESTNRVPGE